MARVYTPEGEIIPLNPLEGQKTLSLEQLQGAVGGYIEIVESSDGQYLLVIDEEGKLKGYPPNHRATELFYFPQYDILVGNVVVAGKDEID
jgi:hypothetical protein